MLLRMLESKPFSLSEARAAGLERWHLRARKWRRVGPRTYASSEMLDSPLARLQAVCHRLPGVAAFSGFTAAWLHGLDVSPCDPIEVTLPEEAGVSARAGIAVRRRELQEQDVVVRTGLRATSAARTVADLGCRLDLVEAVVVIDMALHRGILDSTELAEFSAGCSGQRGAKNLRRAIELSAADAESPMETRLRLLLVLSRLPAPELQPSLFDGDGQYLGRPDLFYRDEMLGIEYDGSTHRDSLEDDNRRQNRFLDAGIRLLRFTAGDVYNRPEAVVAQVRRHLKRANAGARATSVRRNDASAGARVTAR
jgi:hypothetical protein